MQVPLHFIVLTCPRLDRPVFVLNARDVYFYAKGVACPASSTCRTRGALEPARLVGRGGADPSLGVASRKASKRNSRARRRRSLSLLRRACSQEMGLSALRSAWLGLLLFPDLNARHIAAFDALSHCLTHAVQDGCPLLLVQSIGHGPRFTGPDEAIGRGKLWMLLGGLFRAVLAEGLRSVEVQRILFWIIFRYAGSVFIRLECSSILWPSSRNHAGWLSSCCLEVEAGRVAACAVACVERSGES